jgi:hypothetical protein
LRQTLNAGDTKQADGSRMVSFWIDHDGPVCADSNRSGVLDLIRLSIRKPQLERLERLTVQPLAQGIGVHRFVAHAAIVPGAGDGSIQRALHNGTVLHNRTSGCTTERGYWVSLKVIGGPDQGPSLDESVVGAGQSTQSM